MRTLTLADVANAPKRSFAAGSALAQDLSEWYATANWATVPVFRLGEKDDAERDGSDAQLRDATCLLAGMKRKREAVLNEDGTQAVSVKRGKPQFRDVPFTTRDRLEAMQTLGIHERELSRDGTTRIVAIVKSDVTTDEDDEVLPSEDEELEESPNEDDA